MMATENASCAQRATIVGRARAPKLGAGLLGDYLAPAASTNLQAVVGVVSPGRPCVDVVSIVNLSAQKGRAGGRT